MAFEVFDDVAFYWFLTVLLGLFLIPATIIRLWNYFFSGIRRRHRGHCAIKQVPAYLPKIRLVEDQKLDSKLTLTNIAFAAFWVLFLLCLIQLPRFNRKEMTDFEPFKILELERTATSAQIKRAYRKLSLKHHPDKGGDPQKFFLIRKAYETLTDETKKENYAKYGNPDGYSGTDVTIGLPSWMTRKDNELIILVGYFAILAVLVALVGFWWGHSNRYHKSGVYKQTIDIYWRFMKMGMDIRQLIHVLAASAEYREVDISVPEMKLANGDTNGGSADGEQRLKFRTLMDLKREVDARTTEDQRKANKATGLAATPYVYKTTTLLLSHLLGLTVPPQLEEEMLFVLQEAPRLLDVMIDMTLSRERYFSQALYLINLKQALIQGFLPHESRLRQLPHWNVDLDKTLRKQNLQEIWQLAMLPEDKLNETLLEAFESAETKGSKKDENIGEDSAFQIPLDVRVADAATMIRMFPFVRIGYCVRTYDEDNIYVRDYVTVTVDVERVLDPWEINPEEPVFKIIDAPEVKAADARENADDDELSFVTAEMNEDQRLQLARLNSNIVHANRFPFQIREKWMVMLVHRTFRFVHGRSDRPPIEDHRVIDQKAIPALNGTERVNLHFYAPEQPGKYSYVMLIQCDSYIGADRHINFELTVNPVPEVKKEDEEEHEHFHDEDEEEEWNPKWYYLYNETFWEFLLTLFLLYFIYLIIISSGPGKKYVQPVVDWMNANVWHPLHDVMSKAFFQIYDPIAARILESTGVDLTDNVKKIYLMTTSFFGGGEYDPRDEL